jgi:PAP2 superfamily
VSFALLCTVGALLATWAFRRRRRIAAATAREPLLASHASLSKSRPSLARLGLNPLGLRLVACNVGALVVGVRFFSAHGLTIVWSTVWLSAFLLAAILIVWLNFYFVPGAPKEWFTAEFLFVTFLMVLLTNVLVPLQYGALAMGSRYADPWLASADATMGVHVPTLTAWTWAHPVTSRLATLTYFTFAPQLLLTVLALAALRERERLWEFAFHFHVCLIVTIAALAVWPSVCAATYYGMTPTIDMTRAIAQIKGFHEGSMTVVRFDDVDGLVSFPSFHVVGALLVTWAFRHRRGILIPLIVLNSGLVISTVLTGEHYVVDVLAAVPLVAGSVAAYRWWGQPWLTADELVPQSKAA